MASVKYKDRRTYGFKSRVTAEKARDIAETADATTYLEGKPRGGSGSGGIQVKTPAGGIPAKTGTGEAGDAYVYGSATCDLIDPSTGLRFSPNRQQTIYNQVNVALGGNLQYGCVRRSGRWFVDVGDCPAPASPPVSVASLLRSLVEV